ncbi:Copper transport protein ATX1 [Carex littledalei]|uniref:Copper transport protein ATX1 n=1 Tax=Carex littledalei TaxID=544730 RepID=A0A833VIY3_9POAL|nr:Copper transport protein ATX1 [Carex littledalei]
MASLEEGPEPFKYQTMALKVSIHCEGCKRKVKKVLHSIEGVYHTAIDIRQQKVIVIGNVDPNSLVRKLNKTGKHAELWPEPIFQNPLSGGSGGSGGGGRKKSKNKKKTNMSSNSTEPQKPNEINSEQNQASSSDEASSPEEQHPEKPDQDRENEKEKPKGGAVTIIHNPTFNQNPPPQTVQVGGGGGGKKKKKKKKKNNNNNNNNGGNIGGGVGTEMTAQEMPVSAIVSHGFIGGGAGGHLDAIGYPVGAAPHIIPSYVVNYSEVQPSASFGSSFHHPTEMGPPAGPAYSGGCFYPQVVVTTVPAGGGSYYMFSEENANACIVM